MPGAVKWLLILVAIPAAFAAVLFVAARVVEWNDGRKEASAAEVARTNAARDRADEAYCIDSWKTSSEQRCRDLLERKRKAALALPDGCDEGARARREKWLDTPNKLRDDMASPTDLGFRSGGPCAYVLISRGINCDEVTVRGVEGDSPYAAQARDLGFLNYACEPISGDQRVEYRLRDIAKAQLRE